MRTSSFVVFCALLLAGSGTLVPSVCADSQPWRWRFQPQAGSRWEIVVLGREKSLTVKDMLHTAFDDKGAQTLKPIHPEIVDQASHRVRFDVVVLSRDASGCRMRWTFRGMTATRERDGWAESTLGDEAMPPDFRAQVQKQRRLHSQKSRNNLTRASQKFTQSLAGASFSCAVEANGRVTWFGGWDGWKKRVTQAISVANDGDFLSLAFPPVLAPDEMKTWVQGWTEGLHDAPVTEGENWQFAAKVADLGFLTPLSTVTRTLRTQHETRAVVDETAAFIVAPPIPKLEPNTVAYTFSCQGTRKAQLQVDRVSGVPTRISRRLDIKGKRGVVDFQGGSLQNEAFTMLVTSEIVAQPHLQLGK